MKNKILPLIIGILIGVIITSAGFMIYMKTNKAGRRGDFRPPEMSDRENVSRPDFKNGEKPEGFPDKRKSDSSNENTTDNTTNSQSNGQTESKT